MAEKPYRGELCGTCAVQAVVERNGGVGLSCERKATCSDLRWARVDADRNGYARGIAKGRALEREATIKHLWHSAGQLALLRSSSSRPAADALFAAADEIERGEHAKEGK